MSHRPLPPAAPPPRPPLDHLPAARQIDRWPTWATYALAIAATGATFFLRQVLGSAGDEPLLEIFLLPIFLSAYLGGRGPGLVATAMATILIFYPVSTPAVLFPDHSAEWAILVITGTLTSWLVGGLHNARGRAEAHRQLLEATLASMGDAVVTTDPRGRVTFLNEEAERLTGWSAAEAIGRQLREICTVFDEQTGTPLADPVALVLGGNTAAGSRLRMVLRARDGRETPIDKSSAPIRAAGDSPGGIVLVFRDISAQRRAEDERRRSEQTLRLFVEHAPAAIAMFDRSMRYLAASRRFLGDYRLGDQNIIGRSHYEIFPDIPERWRVIHQHCMADATEHCAMDAFPRADGSLDWVRWELRPWYERPGEVGGLVLFSEVVTERVHAEAELRASEARYHQTLDCMLEGCQIIGFDWRYRYVNDSVARHACLPREALLGRTIMEAFPGIETTPFFATLRRCMEQRVAERLENHFVYSDGSSAWFDLSVQPSPEGLFILSIEISERKEAEAALAAERAHLAERVAEATADLRQANVGLATAARLKDEFLATMSHELRTPLNAILGYTELLRDEVYGPVSPRQTDALQNLETSGRHLLELISDLLDLSKLSAGKLTIDPTPVDAAAICRLGLGMVSQEALRRRIELSSSLDPRVRTIEADERRLLQILANLLANAIKFTPEGGRVGLELRGDVEAGRAIFTVWDTGIGIAKKDLGQLFKPFSQIDSGLNRQYEGSGLGLALARRLALAHGGDIAVTSAPGQGSRFGLSLPWAGPPATPRSGQPDVPDDTGECGGRPDDPRLALQ